MSAVRTRVLKASAASAREAARVLAAGGLVAVPTETVYGLACALDPEAAARAFRAKGRPADNPLIVHVLDAAQLRRVARRLTPLARRLIGAFWPGPLTLVLERGAAVPRAVTAGRDTVAVRMPSHPAARAVLRALGAPFAAPSANRSGRPSPTTAAHVLRDLKGRVPLVLDGGACRVGLESTVVDARGRAPVLLRPGSVTLEALARVARRAPAAPGRRAPPSPGTRHRHYAPRCRVVLVSPADVRAGRLPRGAALYHRAPSARRAGWTRRSAGLAAYARGLFAALRDAEKSGVRTLAVETVPETGVGHAVMDRLRRAAERM
jgi:L-threonylcarbamoyladenylate synthase